MLDLSVEGDPSCTPLLGRDEDDSISGTSSIEGRGGGILEDREGLDVRHIEATEERVVGDPIDDIEWGGIGVHRPDPTDLYGRTRTRLSTRGEDLHPRGGTLEGRGDIGARLLGQSSYIDTSSRSREGVLALGTVGHDDDLVESPLLCL